MTMLDNEVCELNSHELDQVAGSYSYPHYGYPPHGPVEHGFSVVWLGNGAGLIEKHLGRYNDFRLIF